MGIDANIWGTQTEQLWNSTFVTYLSAETNCTFTMTLYPSPDIFVAAVVSEEVDLFFTGPGVFVCLQVSYIFCDTL